MSAFNHPYNSDRDTSKGFNQEPLTDGREISQDERDAALKRIEDLIERIKDGLHE